MGQRDINKSELARRLGLSDTWVGRRLKGITRITLNDLDAMIAAIGCPLSAVWPQDDDQSRRAA